MKQKSKTPHKGTPENPNPRNAGVDKKPIDYDKVKQLARFMYTDEEMAVALGVCSKTLQRRRQDDPKFIEAMEQGHNEGRRSLRSAQFANAMKGNTTMQIWLGKQYLGQKDSISNEITGKNGGPIDITDAKAALLRGVVPKPTA